MIVITATEFKAKCLQLLDQVSRTGERIQVTKRGKVVAELGPSLASETQHAPPGFAKGKIKIHFGTGNDCSEDYYYFQVGCATASALGLGNQTAMGRAGFAVSTQSAAQSALNAINQAIISKDKIRAALGAIQNRLENTISALQIQAENTQAGESRISDVDVASEMTEFVRNQVLTQAAVAMLSQANSLPKMALQLIQG